MSQAGSRFSLFGFVLFLSLTFSVAKGSWSPKRQEAIERARKDFYGYLIDYSSQWESSCRNRATCLNHLQNLVQKSEVFREHGQALYNWSVGRHSEVWKELTFLSELEKMTGELADHPSEMTQKQLLGLRGHHLRILGFLLHLVLNLDHDESMPKSTRLDLSHGDPEAREHTSRVLDGLFLLRDASFSLSTDPATLSEDKFFPLFDSLNSLADVVTSQTYCLHAINFIFRLIFTLTEGRLEPYFIPNTSLDYQEQFSHFVYQIDYVIMMLSQLPMTTQMERRIQEEFYAQFEGEKTDFLIDATSQHIKKTLEELREKLSTCEDEGAFSVDFEANLLKFRWWLEAQNTVGVNARAFAIKNIDLLTNLLNNCLYAGPYSPDLVSREVALEGVQKTLDFFENPVTKFTRDWLPTLGNFAYK